MRNFWSIQRAHFQEIKPEEPIFSKDISINKEDFLKYWLRNEKNIKILILKNFVCFWFEIFFGDYRVNKNSMELSAHKENKKDTILVSLF